MARDYRGKGTSKTKVSKCGEQKHAGNFSYQTIHYQSLQSKDYFVCNQNGVLIVGKETLLSELMGADVMQLALTDEHFSAYYQDGVKTIGNKEHEAHKRLTKIRSRYRYTEAEFIYREEIYTDGDFDYDFPEY